MSSGGLNVYNVWDDEEHYVITEDRLNEIRGEMMYPYTDPNDYQKDINDLTPQIDKKLNFRFPFYGFLFNYTWVSGAVCFFSNNLGARYQLHMCR